jgi:8-oxo-dGTP pyrophosphatase MutT (NUDIX family)
VFKECPNPIISCGIILLNVEKLPVDPSKVKVLMVQRKHSMAFTEFVRGKYEFNNNEYIKKLISNMTFEEQGMLRDLEFPKIWTNHWGIGRDHHSHEYETSLEKFNRLDKLDLFPMNLEGFSESEWGFPKGRRQHRESDLNCAMREFSEETNIPRNSYTLCKNLKLEETFFGTNGVEYKHIYFISLINQDIPINNNFTQEQQREICSMDWKTIEDCSKFTRPHYIKRKEILNSLKTIIKTFHT